MIYKEYNGEMARDIAARLGLLVAAFWIVSFLIVVLNYPSMMSDLGYLVGFLSVITLGRNIRGVASLVMPMNWAQRLGLAFLSLMGGVLLTTLAQFVYFAYFDHGQFLNGMLEMVTEAEFVKLMKEAGNGMLLSQMTETLKHMIEMTPRELTINLFSTNMTFAMVFALIASLFRGKADSASRKN